MSSDTPPFPPRGVPAQPFSANHAHNNSSVETGGDLNNGGALSLSGSSSSNIPITLEEVLKVGSVIRAVTIHGVKHQGEIMAVDNKSRLVFIAVPNNPAKTTQSESSSGAPLASSGLSSASGAHHVLMLNLDMLQDLKTVKEASDSSQTSTLAPCRINDAEQKMKMTVAKKLKRVEAIGVGVTAEAQRLFDKLSQQYDCSWSGSSINVNNLKVTIKEPYLSGVGDASCVVGDNAGSVQHVRKLVEQIMNPAHVSKQQPNNQSNRKSLSSSSNVINNANNTSAKKQNNSSATSS